MVFFKKDLPIVLPFKILSPLVSPYTFNVSKVIPLIEKSILPLYPIVDCYKRTPLLLP